MIKSRVTIVALYIPFVQSKFLSLISYSAAGSGFFTGGKDNKIFKMDLHGNPVMMYEGHEQAVNSLSQPTSEELVSGSWDG